MATAGFDAIVKVDFSAKVSEACEAGEKFIQVFFDAMDKRRQIIPGLYSDSSFLVWNGHTKSGAKDISQFYQSLPDSEHTLMSFDCQPVLDDPSQTTVLVSCDGTVKYDTEQSREEAFAQNFLLTKLGDVWKISNDCFRFLDK